MSSKTITIRPPKKSKLKNELKELAKRKGDNLNKYVCEILARHVKTKNRQ